MRELTNGQTFRVVPACERSFLTRLFSPLPDVVPRATLHLNLGSEGGQREVQHGDELVTLAAQTLLRLCELYDDAGGGASASGKSVVPTD